MDKVQNITNEVTGWLWGLSGLNKFNNSSYDYYTRNHFKEEYNTVVRRVVEYLYEDDDTALTIEDKLLLRFPSIFWENGDCILNVILKLLAEANDVTKFKDIVVPKESRRFYDIKSMILKIIVSRWNKIKDCWLEMDDENRIYYVFVIKSHDGKRTWTFHQPERYFHNIKLTPNHPLRKIKEWKAYHRESQTDVEKYIESGFELKDYTNMLDILYLLYHLWKNKNY